jgi:hypothetical protein
MLHDRSLQQPVIDIMPVIPVLPALLGNPASPAVPTATPPVGPEVELCPRLVVPRPVIPIAALPAHGVVVVALDAEVDVAGPTTGAGSVKA